jgi:alpha-mannosidase
MIVLKAAQIRNVIPEHDVTARHAYGYAQGVANQVMYLALQRLAWQVPAEDPNSDYLLVFNPHAWGTRRSVEYDFNRHPRVASKLTDEQGRNGASQWVQGSTGMGDRHTPVFYAPLLAFSYRQFRLRKTSERAAPSGVHVNAGIPENEHGRVIFSRKGTVGIFDQDAGRYVFRGSTGGARAVVLNDPSDTWSHNVVPYSDEIYTFGSAAFNVLERRPLRGRVRMHRRHSDSALETDWILYAGSRTLEARC